MITSTRQNSNKICLEYLTISEKWLKNLEWLPIQAKDGSFGKNSPIR